MNKITIVVFIVFLILKLAKVIYWPWIWVTSPLWIPFVWGFAVALFCVLYGFKIEKK